MHITRKTGMLLLAIWLILYGLAAFIPVLSGLGMILAILAIVAGIFILLER
jgi:4-hydroxybenzoate polyprenyltransferase